LALSDYACEDGEVQLHPDFTGWRSWEVAVTVEPGHEMGAAAGGGHLRASHADREHVIAKLKVAFVQGRLSKAELDARVGQALASRTYRELAALTADLPAGLTTAPPPGEPVRAGAQPAMGKVVAGAALIIPPPALALAALFTGDELLAKVFLLVIPWYFLAWIVAGAQMLSNWHDNRSGGQPPPGRTRGRQAVGRERDDGGSDVMLCVARPITG
jgi:hypothetical protein